MKHIGWITAGLLFGATPALAEGSAVDADVRATLRGALEEKATLPAQPPTLPDAASDRATEAHLTTAFGKKGAIERTARDLAGKQAEAHARKAQAGAAQAHRRGAVGEAHKANADSRSAAARERTDKLKSRGGNREPGGGDRSDGQFPNRP